jgi:hypothetical protein
VVVQEERRVDVNSGEAGERGIRAAESVEQQDGASPEHCLLWKTGGVYVERDGETQSRKTRLIKVGETRGDSAWKRAAAEVKDRVHRGKPFGGERVC